MSLYCCQKDIFYHFSQIFPDNKNLRGVLTFTKAIFQVLKFIKLQKNSLYDLKAKVLFWKESTIVIS